MISLQKLLLDKTIAQVILQKGSLKIWFLLLIFIENFRTNG